MTVKHVWMVFMLGAAAAACTKDTGGTLTNPTPVAYLRYFNAVPDTGNVDFRVVDILGYAPNQVQASFRSGGNPSGIATTFYPPYQAVQAGSRMIRVFLDGTTIATAGTILNETTYDFQQGTYYTFYVYGYANSPTNGSPQLASLITVDTMPTIPAANIAVRTVNLSNDTTGMGATVDAFVIAQANSPAGTPTIAGSTFLKVSPFVNVATGATLKTVVTRGGTTTAAATANLPAGVVGTTTNCPTTERIAGSAVAGTSFTAVILPRSTPGTGAAAFAAPGVVFLIDLQPPNVCP
jgi:hypothetical protein